MTAACLSGHDKVVHMLLENGASIDTPNSQGLPPILCSAKAGHWQLVDTFLYQGAALEQTDRHGHTALMLAASEGHLGVLEMLLAKGEQFGGFNRCNSAALFTVQCRISFVSQQGQVLYSNVSQCTVNGASLIGNCGNVSTCIASW